MWAMIFFCIKKISFVALLVTAKNFALFLISFGYFKCTLGMRWKIAKVGSLALFKLIRDFISNRAILFMFAANVTAVHEHLVLDVDGIDYDNCNYKGVLRIPTTNEFKLLDTLRGLDLLDRNLFDGTFGFNDDEGLSTKEIDYMHYRITDLFNEHLKFKV